MRIALAVIALIAVSLPIAANASAAAPEAGVADHQRSGRK